MSVPDVSSSTVADLVSLDGRVAVVTGGARGIGFAIARRFAEVGAKVAIGDIDREGAQRAAASLREEYGTASIGLEVNVCDEESVKQLASEAVAELGHLRIWVNNAGIFPITPVLDLTSEQWDRVVGVNLKGAFLGAREAAHRMRRTHDSGVIINLSSVAGYRGATIGGSDYVSAKHGIRGLTRALAAELGVHGIRVLALAPSTTWTPGLEASREQVKADGLSPSAGHREAPLGRDGVADDVARVALFCACDLSMLMTGGTLAVDGGRLVVS